MPQEELVAVLERLRKKTRRKAKKGSKRRRSTRIKDVETLLAFAKGEAGRIVGRWKRRAHRTRSIFEVRQIADPGPGAATPSVVDSPGLIEFVRARLSPAELRLLMLRYLRGLVGKELAQRLGISNHELSCRLWRLKEKLRRLLRPEEPREARRRFRDERGENIPL